MSSRSNHARLVALEKEMEEAAANFDFERAAALRDEIARWKGEDEGIVGQPPPGQMGLGSNVPVREPPKNWVKPKKPDFMTKNVKPRGGR
ncbi:UvrB/UvrC motif-containing protein [Devosia aurantiaca]|uniref:Excinuclease ABC subunit B n=1 Tax=Devosia aurantiaca TaxID=2714858 RepID=A0A6M1SQ60_9HYPH|nr:UvrB/UvrC motif-containing protein [Devosia aurantiaca]NGP19368.1 excinuclease ABC subunit B [Devosia aurantiaca]